jgi:Tfp pilus assembly protein FimT
MDALREYYARRKPRAFQSDAISTDATPRETGGKRHGRRLARKAQTTRVEAIPTERLREIAESHPDAVATVKRKGSKRYATMIVYVDESRKRATD